MLYKYFAFTDGYNRMSFSLQINKNTSTQWSDCILPSVSQVMKIADCILVSIYRNKHNL